MYSCVGPSFYFSGQNCLHFLVPDAKYVGGTSNDHLSFIVLVSSYWTKRAFGSFRFQGTGVAAVSVPAIATPLLENSKPQLFFMFGTFCSLEPIDGG